MIISTLSTLINRYLSLDPNTVSQLKDLKGKVILFDIKSVGKFYCLPNDEGMQITNKHEGDADATIKGSLWNLFKASRANSQIEAGQNKLEISGDIELGEKISRIFREMDIDWEEQTSKVIGDVPAHKLGEFVRRAKSWVQKGASSVKKNVTEYMQEETKQLPTRAEVDDFIKDVTELSHAVDRLEARIQKKAPPSAD